MESASKIQQFQAETGASVKDARAMLQGNHPLSLSLIKQAMLLTVLWH